jgi:hypothetical protein
MPWFPEIEAGRVIARSGELNRDRSRIPFFDGIRSRDPEDLAGAFAGDPVVDDPRHGNVEGKDAFAGCVFAMRDWLVEQTAGGTELIRITRTPARFVEEVSVKLNGDHPELPVAIVSDLAEDGRLRAIRVYHSLWPLTGGHEVRAPLLPADPSIELKGAPADYQRALAVGDAEGIVAAFESDGVVREPSGGPFTYSGEAHHRIYDLMFANGGGIPLEFCTVTDDGVACAIEYNAVRWGKDPIPPQAGVAVYERGRSGRLAAARIYDDVTPPESSDSSVQSALE